MSVQTSIFDEPVPRAPFPEGLLYREEFITPEEERSLIEIVQTLPLSEARYQQYTARRRTMNYGAGYDFTHLQTTAAPPIPGFLQPLRIRAAEWAGVAPEDFVQALIAEYAPGTPLGWHRDVPDYELIFGLTLAGKGRLRFRPYPWNPERKKDIFALEPERRSAYLLRDRARWEWQHSVPPAKVLRYSITLRTQRRVKD
jgi:alkylated DNA repair dioxygenase AlkB